MRIQHNNRHDNAWEELEHKPWLFKKPNFNKDTRSPTPLHMFYKLMYNQVIHGFLIYLKYKLNCL